MNKNMKITLIITFSLFGFVIFMLYLLYCYGYYDKHMEDVYLEKANNTKFVYDKMVSNKRFSKDKYESQIDFMTNKEKYNQIYNTYYKEKYSRDEFFSIYFYGDYKVNSVDLDKKGKTGFFKRSKFRYKGISISNADGYNSSLGFKDNISFNIDNGATIYVDKKKLTCSNNKCLVNLLGGIHEISYLVNGDKYYALVNIYKNDMDINVGNILSLVLCNEEKVTEVNEDISSLVGTKKIKECYKEASCANKSKSYLDLRSDGTCTYHLDIPFEVARDHYEGTYRREGNFLILSFKSHTYNMFDYDTKVWTAIKQEGDTEIRFKIEGNKLIGEQYKFE